MGASGGYTFYDSNETARAINDSGLSKGATAGKFGIFFSFVRLTPFIVLLA